jgi:hypothetical protein
VFKANQSDHQIVASLKIENCCSLERRFDHFKQKAENILRIDRKTNKSTSLLM